MNEESQSHGRVSLDKDAKISGFAYPTTAPSNAGQEGIRGNFERTPLNQAFFSTPNFQIIQNKIRKEVYDKSGEIIDPVSTDDLFMVMRAIYLQNSRNLPTNIPEQIHDLNERVAAWCIPKIVSEVSMYRTYAKDISTLPVPMSHPVNQSGAGTKSLPFKNFF
jgi:hypothetical protein